MLYNINKTICCIRFYFSSFHHNTTDGKANKQLHLLPNLHKMFQLSFVSSFIIIALRSYAQVSAMEELVSLNLELRVLQSSKNESLLFHRFGQYKIPRIGFGTAKLNSPYDTINLAIEQGYRLFDTACEQHPAYDPKVLGHAIANSGIPREEFFIETKNNFWEHGYHSTVSDIIRSLELLQTDYLDVYLIHKPQCYAERCKYTWRETWRAMEDVFLHGLTTYKSIVLRSIGVSNFDETSLTELLYFARVKPSIVQNYHDILHQDWGVIDLCKKHGIAYQAYSSFGGTHSSGIDNHAPFLSSKPVQHLADKYGKTPAQIILKWIMQLDLLTIPKSNQIQHIKQNKEVLSFELNSNDMALLRGTGESTKKQLVSHDISIIWVNSLPNIEVYLYWLPHIVLSPKQQIKAEEENQKGYGSYFTPPEELSEDIEKMELSFAGKIAPSQTQYHISFHGHCFLAGTRIDRRVGQVSMVGEGIISSITAIDGSDYRYTTDKNNHVNNENSDVESKKADKMRWLGRYCMISHGMTRDVVYVEFPQSGATVIAALRQEALLWPGDRAKLLRTE